MNNLFIFIWKIIFLIAAVLSLVGSGLLFFDEWDVGDLRTPLIITYVVICIAFLIKILWDICRFNLEHTAFFSFILTVIISILLYEGTVNRGWSALPLVLNLVLIGAVIFFHKRRRRLPS